MHSTSRAVFAFVALMTVRVAGGACVAEAAIAVWTSNGPEGEVVRALAIDPLTPSTLYAGADDGGVFKSTDAGGNWSAVNSALPNADVRALAIDPLTGTTRGSTSAALCTTPNPGC